jgi:hypothetical protein
MSVQRATAALILRVKRPGLKLISHLHLMLSLKMGGVELIT